MYKIVDASGRRSTIVSYFSEESARDDIQSWIRRNERGGRPDIRLELLESLRVVPDDGS